MDIRRKLRYDPQQLRVGGLAGRHFKDPGGMPGCGSRGFATYICWGAYDT
jgi:hypothetical protein